MGFFRNNLKKENKPLKKTASNNVRQNSKQNPTPKSNNVGKVYRGKTKYIDKETKPERNYVVVADNGKNVSVAKLKSIKKFDEKGANADTALVEINQKRYGLEKRTGVDFQRFRKNRMSGKPLSVSDKDVFPDGKEMFKLNSKDKHNVLIHTKAINDPKKKKTR